MSSIENTALLTKFIDLFHTADTMTDDEFEQEYLTLVDNMKASTEDEKMKNKLELLKKEFIAAQDCRSKPRVFN